MNTVAKPVSKGRPKLDPSDRRFLTDLLSILFILVATIALYSRLGAPAALVGGGLALTVFVAADVVLFGRG